MSKSPHIAHPALAAAPSPKTAAVKRGRRPATQGSDGPDGTVQNILEAATQEFADKGFSGARVDAIAELTRTSKRMIYYHFVSKEGLYLAVLEHAYGRIRRIENELALERLSARDALQKLVGFTFDYHVANPDFVRLVMNENILNGAFLAKSKSIEQVNRSAVASLSKLYQRGREQGVFRDGIDPVDLHMSISALCFFTVANRHTFSLGFKHDLTSLKALAARRASIIDMVMRDVQPRTTGAPSVKRRAVP